MQKYVADIWVCRDVGMFIVVRKMLSFPFPSISFFVKPFQRDLHPRGAASMAD